MVKLLKKGRYNLIETKGQTKILTFDNKDTFAWVNAGGEIGEILVASHKTHKTDHILATGEYCLYQVKDEPKLTDLEHLELEVGSGIWQGYLLSTGLPTDQHKRNRIIPTNEVIAKPTG